MSKTVTIHQPDFMPWLGLYNKISKVDELVILDHVTNNPRDSAFWCRRVQMIVSKKPGWISIPLVKEPGKIGVPICEMKINTTETKLLRKTLDTIRINYSKAPFFKKIFPWIESFFLSEEQNLVKRNFDFLQTTLKALNISPNIVFSSTLNCQHKSTELLVEIMQKRGGNLYICGAGAAGYQNDDLFAQNGIGVRHNSFSFFEYSQFNTDQFYKGLSAVDAFMNVGIEGTETIIKTERL